MDYAITMIWYLILLNGDTYFETATKDFMIIIKTGLKKIIWTLSVFLSKMFKWNNIKWGMLCQRDFLNTYTLMYLKIESEMKLLRWGID